MMTLLIGGTWFKHNGVTKQALATAFGVSFNTIKDIVSGRTWKHLLGDHNG